jgi:hypothetical protein
LSNKVAVQACGCELEGKEDVRVGSSHFHNVLAELRTENVSGRDRTMSFLVGPFDPPILSENIMSRCGNSPLICSGPFFGLFDQGRQVHALCACCAQTVVVAQSHPNSSSR